ncbi:MAG: glycosyltransferase family 39 protein [Candidatus Binataceae bacterium]
MTSTKSAAVDIAAASHRIHILDIALLSLVLVLSFTLMEHSGIKRGAELMPWPDGLEYAAAAVNLDRGLGPVLHFGGYSYPSRYTEGYPLLLAASLPLVGRDVAQLSRVTLAFGMIALAALYVLTLRLFGRLSALFASLLLATSPLFVTYSTLVLSNVPTLAVTVLAALALAAATDVERIGARGMWLWWPLFGLLAGFTVMIRPSNAVLLAGVAAALWLVPPAGVGLPRWKVISALGLAAAAFCMAPLIQAAENVRQLGHAFASGYSYWVPEVYGAAGKTFNVAFAFGPTMPRNPYGNVPVYILSLLGFDTALQGAAGPSYFLYPFAAAAFAAIGLGAILRMPGHRAERRVVIFGLGFLTALVAEYIFYFFTEVAFILPATFVVFMAAGYGAVVANRWMRDVFAVRSRNAYELAGMLAVLALDLLLIGSITTVISGRLQARPPDSTMLSELATASGAIHRGATVVSNVSLLFLELYEAAPGREFVALTADDPGESYTDYHVSRLYAKRAAGFRGRVPPALFENVAMSSELAKSLLATSAEGKPLYLLLAAPRSPVYAETLKRDLDALDTIFMMEPVMRGSELVLFQLKPR